MKIKLNDLKKAGKEINKLDLFEEQIDVKTSEKDLREKLEEAFENMDEDEREDLTDGALKTLEALTVEEAAEEEEEKPKKGKGKAKAKEEDASLSLEETVEETEDIEELKNLIKTDDAFVTIRKGLALQKNVEKLKIRMFKALEEAQKTPEKSTPKQKVKDAVEKDAKKEEKKAKDKIEGKDKKQKYTRVLSICKAVEELGVDKDFKVIGERADEIYVEMTGKRSIPRESIFITRHVIPALTYFKLQ